MSVDTGGDYQPWVSPPVFTEDWQCDGKMVRENAIARHGSDAQVIQSRKFWFKPGLAYPYTSSIGFGTSFFQKAQFCLRMQLRSPRRKGPTRSFFSACLPQAGLANFSLFSVIIGKLKIPRLNRCHFIQMKAS